MDEKTTTKPSLLRLEHTDLTAVVVTPADEDRFITTAQAAAKACQAAQHKDLAEKEWQEYFKNFLNAILRWAESDDITEQSRFTPLFTTLKHFLLCMSITVATTAIARIS